MHAIVDIIEATRRTRQYELNMLLNGLMIRNSAIHPGAVVKYESQDKGSMLPAAMYMRWAGMALQMTGNSGLSRWGRNAGIKSVTLPGED